jgi:uncharacterized small protein (DUF1192 family)
MAQHTAVLICARLVPALVLSLFSSTVLTLPMFQKNIGDERITVLQEQNHQAEAFIHANQAKRYSAGGVLNAGVDRSLSEKNQLIAANDAEIRRIKGNVLRSADGYGA